ncbi:hypothetical protein [Dyadobacter bucti]|nr:hypothetical protein [Dyadobacter bucti]
MEWTKWAVKWSGNMINSLVAGGTLNKIGLEAPMASILIAICEQKY